MRILELPELTRMLTDVSRRIASYIARLTMHAADTVMTDVLKWNDHIEIKADKVGGWLMNEEATNWDNVSWIEIPSPYEFDY